MFGGMGMYNMYGGMGGYGSAYGLGRECGNMLTLGVGVLGAYAAFKHFTKAPPSDTFNGQGVNDNKAGGIKGMLQSVGPMLREAWDGSTSSQTTGSKTTGTQATGAKTTGQNLNHVSGAKK